MSSLYKKDMDLLAGLKSAEKSGKNARFAAAALPVLIAAAISVGAVALSSGYLKNAESDSEKAQRKADAAEQTSVEELLEENQSENDRLTAACEIAETLGEKRSSSAELAKKLDPDIADKINGCLGNGIRCEYGDMTSYGVELGFSADNAGNIPEFVKKVEQTGLFQTVDYSGFSESGGRSAFQLVCTVSGDGEVDSQ